MFQTISETYELHSGTANVQIKCRWQDRHQVVASFLEGGEHSTPVEFPFPLGSSGTPLVASSVTIEPMQTKYKTDGQVIEYKYALIRLTYQMMATDIDIQSTTQWLQIYPAGLYWKITNPSATSGFDKVQVTQDEVPGIKFPSYDITLSHPHIKSTFEGGSFYEYEGFVNSDHITVWYNGVELEFLPETLLCTSPSVKAGANLYGSGFNNISLKLSYNPLTHNKFFNPKQNMGNPSATLQDHAVEMYVNDEQGERRIIIFPAKPFKPIFEAFKFRVTDWGDFVGGGGSGTNANNSNGNNNGNSGNSSGEGEGDNNGENPIPADLGIDDGYHTGGN